jgi:putative spermidine/putrescine transport system ATP-binding protein
LNSAADRPRPLLPDAGAGAPDGNAAVRLNGVTKRFGKTTAVNAISLQVRRGELLTLLGPSGCGKTTLLNLIAGFLQPDDGAVVVNGQDITDLPAYQRGIGIMFQSYALFPHMNVAANVGYGLRMRRLAKSEISRRVEETLALVKLDGLEERKPRQLSGGQQQRVALARAIVIRPNVLLLDEPFSALDRNLRASMQVEIKEIQRKLGVTTIFVTHDQSEALSLSDRIAVIAEGTIRQLGTPEEIYRRPSDRFVASFVGDINVFQGRIESINQDAVTVAVGPVRIAVPEQSLRARAIGEPVELFVRPEALRVIEPDKATALTGVVTTRIFQGGHIDLHVAVAEAQSGRLLIRVAGHADLPLWPVGAQVGVVLPADGTAVFATAGPTPAPRSALGA